MIPSLPYIIKSSVLLAMLLIYYDLFLKKQTFFQLNRIYLLGALLLSVSIPFLHFTVMLENQYTDATLPTLYYVSGLMEEITIQASASPEKEIHLLSWFYLAGICYFSIRYLRSCYKIYRFIRSHHCKRIRGLKLVAVGKGYPTFSFFNYLFIDTASLNKENKRKIIEHEKIHIRQAHSLDLCLCEIVCILNWFNPLVWICKNIISQNHEYIADQQVIRKYQTGSYLQLLVNQSLKGEFFSFTNYFSCSNLKKRVIMMTKKQTKKYKIINYIPALLLSGILCITFTCITEEAPALPSVKVFAEEPSPEPAPLIVSVQQKDTSAVFKIVEIMPHFKGNLQKFLKENLAYPLEAQNKGIQGKVYLQFIVEKDGSLSDIKVSRGAHALLDKEALRVVKAMPAWTPGQQRGQKVRTAFTLPINFQLNGKKESNEVVVVGYSTQKKDTAKISLTGAVSSPVLTAVEVMPQFKGNLTKFIHENLKYPEEAQKQGAQGKAFVEFVVQRDGTVSNIRISKSSGNTELDNEAMRVVKMMPAWTPGKHEGKNVDVKFNLPFNFATNDTPK